MSNARFVFCEQRSRWAAWTGRHADLRSYEVQSLDECWDHLRAAPASLIVVELTSCPIKPMIEFLVQVRERNPDGRVMVVGSRADCRFEWLLREAGAVAAFFDPRSAEWLARQAERHFASVPRDGESVEQQIIDRLPWGDFAGS